MHPAYKTLICLLTDNNYIFHIASKGTKTSELCLMLDNGTFKDDEFEHCNALLGKKYCGWSF